jgi:hypothetical protein
LAPASEADSPSLRLLRRRRLQCTRAEEPHAAWLLGEQSDKSELETDIFIFLLASNALSWSLPTPDLEKKKTPLSLF